ncbi:MAG: exopolysaccharide biosynthesis polyprenyl glycosylphosphotransferase [bacterium]
MKSNKVIMLKFMLLVFDIIAITASFFLAIFLRFHNDVHIIRNQWSTFFFILIVMLIIKYFYDLYNHYYYAQAGRVFFKLINVWIISFIAYVIAGFLTKFYFLINSRGFIFCFFIVYPIIILLLRTIIIPAILKSYFSRPERRILCQYIGPDDKFPQFHKFFKENTIIGLDLIAFEHNKENPNTQEIFLYSEENDFGNLYKEIQKYATQGRRFHLVSQLLNEFSLNWDWCKIENLRIFSFKVNGDKKWQHIVRRILDIILSTIFLIIILPAFLIIGIAIKLDSPGPIVYKQKRNGKDGKEFTLYKFRSMYSNNSPAKREQEFRDFIEKKIAAGKVIDPTEVTTVGKILRRTSLDEFPQFFNVLKGDMTLIGPRPPLPYEVKYYKEWHKDRLRVKPGVSGLWQVYGRGSMPCDSSIFLDLLYTFNQSITLDIILLFQTIPAVLLGKGAY